MSLVACECPPGPGLEPEPCSRARSQACMYLEQIRHRVAAGTADMTKRDYLVDAATQIHLALERDVSEDYEAAFNYYQNGVDVLLRGVHVDPNKERCEAVKLKITKYLRRAEEIFNCHLQRTLGSGTSPNTGFSSLRLRPIRTLSSALEQLKGCRVVGIIKKVQVVQDPATGGTFVVKAEPSQVSHGEPGAADHHPTRRPLHDKIVAILRERGLHLPAPGARARRHPLVTSTLPGPLSTLGAQVWLCPGEVQSPTQHWPQPYDPSKAPTRPHLEAGQNPSGASVDFPEPSPSPPASERG